MNTATTSRNLEPGCYLVSFRANDKARTKYVGTLRVTSETKDSKSETFASGDLYEIDDAKQIRPSELGLSKIPDLGRVTLESDNVIPNFPVSAYRYYLDVQEVNGLSLILQAHRYDPVTKRLTPGANCQLTLASEGASDPLTLTGELAGPSGKRGDFYLQYLGKNLRQAKLRLFTLGYGDETDIDFPGGEGKEAGAEAALKIQWKWQSVFSKIGWDLQVEATALTESEFALPDGKAWSPYDLGVNATARREGIPSDEWVYDLLCVSRFENASYLGMMFDAEATDLNQQPRECAAVAALQAMPVATDEGRTKLQPFQKIKDGQLYFRTALHELGHCLNLTHSLTTRTLMDTTDCVLAHNGAGYDDSTEIKLDFTPEDIFWLQHAPDVAVRPGGVARRKLRWQRRQRSRTTTVLVRSEPGLTLSVSPVDEEIPIGAPARLDYEVINQGPTTFVPQDISLRGGCVFGSAIGPDQVTRYFRSAFKCCDSTQPDGRVAKLDRNRSVRDGMTLLRGIDAPLFPVPGIYRIELALRWDHRGDTRQVAGETSIVVAAPNPEDPLQAAAAAKALNQPLLMPSIVQGRLDDKSVDALASVLRSKTLAPHYIATVLRCYDFGNRHGLRKTDWEELIQKSLGTKRATKGAKSIRSSISPADFKGLLKAARLTRREKRQLQHLMKSPARPPVPK